MEEDKLENFKIIMQCSGWFDPKDKEKLTQFMYDAIFGFIRECKDEKLTKNTGMIGLKINDEIL